MAFKTLKGKVAERATPGALQLSNGKEVETNKAKPKENRLFSSWSLPPTPKFFSPSWKMSSQGDNLATTL